MCENHLYGHMTTLAYVPSNQIVSSIKYLYANTVRNDAVGRLLPLRAHAHAPTIIGHNSSIIRYESRGEFDSSNFRSTIKPLSSVSIKNNASENITPAEGDTCCTFVLALKTQFTLRSLFIMHRRRRCSVSIVSIRASLFSPSLTAHFYLHPFYLLKERYFSH